MSGNNRGYAGGGLHLPLLLFFVSSLLNTLSSASAHPVEVLTDANFKGKLSEADTWLVEFYAPWCGHCKKLNPILDEVAPKLGDVMRIGKVDSTVQKRISSEYAIQAYPTLKVFRKDQPTLDFEGPRTAEAFIEFAKRLSAPSPTIINTPEELATFRRQHEIFFLLSLSKGREQDELRDTYKAVAQSLKQTASFALTQSDGIAAAGYRSAPFLAKLENGEEPTYYSSSSTPLIILNQEQLSEWIEDNNMPLISALGGHNFRQLGSLGRLLVIAVVDPSQEEQTETFLSRLKEIARNHRELVQDNYVLGYLDGVRWAGFVKQFNILPSQLPRFFILDFHQQTFYEDVEVDEVDEIETFLVDVLSGKVPVQGRGLQHTASRIWQRLVEFFPYSLVLLIPIGLLLSLWLVPSMWVDEEEEKLREATEETAAAAEGEKKEGEGGDEKKEGEGEGKSEVPKGKASKKND